MTTTNEPTNGEITASTFKKKNPLNVEQFVLKWVKQWNIPEVLNRIKVYSVLADVISIARVAGIKPELSLALSLEGSGMWKIAITI